MQGLQYLFLLMSMNFATSVGFCEGKYLSKIEEHDFNSKLDNYLDFMKEDFLRKLNLSGVPQEHRKVQPPQFMIELYNKYASIPRSDVIRSFIIQDRATKLLFNVSIPNHEEITSVQLRLFTLWERSKTTCADLFTSINVYDVEYEQSTNILNLLDGRDLTEGRNKVIGWDKWIVAPPEYDAYECKGVCYFPLTDDVTPSKHAIIQTLVNLSNPKKANMACCIPTKLDPIAVMYQEKGVITVRHLYEEMKVAKCGCR
uniref:Growth differentiation factor 2 n=1 Tax=Sinocyclocheilus anshuiensis TaxID=1608454 RepID=A0A671PDX8_9TELE